MEIKWIALNIKLFFYRGGFLPFAVIIPNNYIYRITDSIILITFVYITILYKMLAEFKLLYLSKEFRVVNYILFPPISTGISLSICSIISIIVISFIDMLFVKSLSIFITPLIIYISSSLILIFIGTIKQYKRKRYVKY